MSGVVIPFPEHRITGPSCRAHIIVEGGRGRYEIKLWRGEGGPPPQRMGTFSRYPDAIGGALRHLAPEMVLADLTREAALGRRKARRC